MKHCILAKFTPEVKAQRAALLPRIRELFSAAADIPGVHGAGLAGAGAAGAPGAPPAGAAPGGPFGLLRRRSPLPPCPDWPR